MKRSIEGICGEDPSGLTCWVSRLHNSGVVLETGGPQENDAVGEFASPGKRARAEQLHHENVGLHETIAVLTQQLAQTEQEVLELKKRLTAEQTCRDINQQYATTHKELQERCTEEMLAFSRRCEQIVAEQRDVSKQEFEGQLAALNKRLQQQHSAALQKQAEEAAAMQSSTEAKCEQQIDQVVQDCMQQVEKAQSECRQKLAAMEQQLQQHVSTVQLNGQGENAVPVAPPLSQPVEHPSSDGRQVIRRPPSARLQQLQSSSAVPPTHRVNQVLHAFHNLFLLLVSRASRL
jgi:hypothetical protein